MLPVDPRPTPRLDQLTDFERELLILLGQGHTAKSIAVLKELSVAAVNERLRAARRKTGVGSSRELARLLSARKNRDDLIGLAAGTDAPPGSSRSDALPLRQASPFKRWRLPMAAAVLLAAALLAQQTATPPPVWNEGLAAEILSRQTVTPDLVALHREVLTEAPDPAWSPGTTDRLATQYRAAPNFGRDIPTFSIRCSADLCEVAGIMRSGITGEELTAVMLHLQTLGRTEPLQGLDQVIHHFGTFPDRPPAFISYWRRSE